MSSLRSRRASGAAAPPSPGPAAFETRELCAADGARLTARLYRGAGQARGAALVAPAMAVPQRFYETFACHLAERGVTTLTFDPRGVGASRRGSLRAVDIDIVGWAERDAQAALDHLRAVAPELPVTWIGHSLGGQIVPFLRDHDELAKIITIAAGSGYWRHYPPKLRRKVWLLWWGAAPLLPPLFGFFPGASLGMVGDLPTGVIRQWRKWCMHPEYAAVEGDEVRGRFAAVTTPLTSLSFTDDELMSHDNIAGLLALYREAPIEAVRLDPAELGVPRLGHFGFFRAEHRALWDRYVLDELAELEAAA